jgi:hypothetical protein
MPLKRRRKGREAGNHHHLWKKVMETEDVPQWPENRTELCNRFMNRRRRSE